MSKQKQRLDILVTERGLAESRTQAQALIMAGEISVNGDVVDKPGTPTVLDAEIVARLRPRFVSRGGDKLEGALVDFGYDPAGKICADVGASTGGFTDCLLQRNVARVYAIDVGYGQLAHKVRSDSRVMSMERTNARYITSLPEPVQLVVIDASFISLKILLPPVSTWLAIPADVIALIKPQFEAGRTDVGKGGVVRHRDIHERVIRETLLFAITMGFAVQRLTRSSLVGPAGNIEFLVWLAWQAPPQLASMEKMIAAALD